MIDKIKKPRKTVITKNLLSEEQSDYIKAFRQWQKDSEKMRIELVSGPI